MDARLDRVSTHLDGYRLSSSLPQQNWSHRSPPTHPPAPSAAFVPFQIGPRYREPAIAAPATATAVTAALDESILARRTAAFRHLNGLNGNPKPLLRRHRQSKSSGGRPSTLAIQPVLVRSLYDDRDEATPASTMETQAGAQQRGPELPSVQDFSIESILRAIEPDIKGTLDSIAEICGRSKLSLANEYGSHIAPFEEIRLAPGGLLTVEETTPDGEGPVDVNNVVIMDDDGSLPDGRDSYGLSGLGWLETLRPAAAAHGLGYPPNGTYSLGEGSSMHAQPDTPRSTALIHPPLDLGPGSRTSPISKEFIATPKPGSQAFLRKTVEPAAADQQANMVTPAVVTEVHLDAPANASSWPSVPPDTRRASQSMVANYPRVGKSRGPPGCPSRIDRIAVVSDVHGWLTWLKGIVQPEDHERCNPNPQSAESTLRSMLERQESRLHGHDHDVTMARCETVVHQ
ncbi:hypothetical protein Egran_04744 [Elaphomyces granulatus]|uniref:Uncharacterized protein n=1 Tax=Elaphomyces granulatus TaxID=519963 RepID=A0A232LTP8_9EURO|nr:hypothetical protein Egran_04744 [Elaphomyces granulatus]